MIAVAPPPHRIAPSMQQASKPRMSNTHLSPKHWAPACFLVNGKAGGGTAAVRGASLQVRLCSLFLFLSSALSLLSWMWALVTDQPPPQPGFPWGGVLFCRALLCPSALLLPHSLSFTGSNPLISLYEIGLVVNPSMPKARLTPGPSHLLWPCL